MPIASATSRRVIGFIADTPRSKKPCWRLTISDTTLTMVRARWSSAFTSQLALCRHSLSQARDSLVLRPGLELLIIAAVDQQPRQRRLVELDREAAAGPANEHVGRDLLRGVAGESAAGLRVVGAELADHVGEVLVVDAADALEVAGAALRQQVEIVDQPRHRRVVAVGRFGLERQAFGERARAHARRVEPLDDVQRLLRPAAAALPSARRSGRAERSDSRSRRASRR